MQFKLYITILMLFSISNSFNYCLAQRQREEFLIDEASVHWNAPGLVIYQDSIWLVGVYDFVYEDVGDSYKATNDCVFIPVIKGKLFPKDENTYKLESTGNENLFLTVWDNDRIAHNVERLGIFLSYIYDDFIVEGNNYKYKTLRLLFLDRKYGKSLETIYLQAFERLFRFCEYKVSGYSVLLMDLWLKCFELKRSNKKWSIVFINNEGQLEDMIPLYPLKIKIHGIEYPLGEVAIIDDHLLECNNSEYKIKKSKDGRVYIRVK